MTTNLDGYRLLNRLDLTPSFTSLGLRPDLFRDGSDRDMVSFDAALNGQGDTLWLFRGEDYLEYDLRGDLIAKPFTSIAGSWGQNALPAHFGLGIDSATWAGPSIPGVAFLFRGAEFVRIEGSDPDISRRPIVQGPLPTHDEWLRTPSTDGAPLYGPDLEPCAKLYGLRDANNRVHFFTRNGRYARHNLENGEYDIAESPTIAHFPLPEEFSGRVDLAFYGAGAEAEHIFFFCRHDYAQFDVRRGAVVRSGAIEQRFPALATLLARPQIFFVEDYSLDSYVGPLDFGRLISTLQVPPQSRLTKVVVTRATVPATIALQQNLLEQPSTVAIADFYDRLAARLPHPPGAIDEGIALWNGEVDALADGTTLDGRRDALVSAALAALADQASQSSHQIKQQLVNLDATTALTGEVLNTEQFDLVNDGSETRQIEFMELTQSYAALLMLRNVRLAYFNGRDRPDIFALREVDARLKEWLVDSATEAPIIAYLRSALASIQDSSGEMRSVLSADLRLDVDARVKTRFVFDDIAPPQILEMFGIVKAARTWRQPTYQTRAVDIHPVDVADRSDIAPVAMNPQGAIAAIITHVPF